MGKYKVLSYLAVGYPLEQRKHPRPKLPLEEMVYWEKLPMVVGLGVTLLRVTAVPKVEIE